MTKVEAGLVELVLPAIVISAAGEVLPAGAYKLVRGVPEMVIIAPPGTEIWPLVTIL